MNLMELNPYLRRASNLRFAPGYLNRRIILDYEFCYMEQGQMLLQYNEKEFLCNPGDFLLICPGIPHRFQFLSSVVTIPHMHFDVTYDFFSEEVFICFQDYPDLTASQRQMIRKNVFPNQANSPFLRISEKERFLDLVQRIIATRDPQSMECRINMMRLLEMMIRDNIADTSTHSSSKERIAQQVRSYIDANYHQAAALSYLENQFGYSKYYIEKLFRQAYQISVIKYQNKKRMEAAIALLKECTVSQTAQKLGFSSIYAFSQAFSRAYGICPTKYMEKLENQ